MCLKNKKRKINKGIVRDNSNFQKNNKSCVRHIIFFTFFVLEFGQRSKKELFFEKSYFFGAGSKLKNEKRFFFVFDAH